MVGETLIALRKKHGFSQQEIADMLDVSRQTISNWECNQGAPTLDKAKQLAAFYHVSLDDLAGSEVEFVSQSQKPISPLLLNMVGKTCDLELDLSSMKYDYLDKSVNIVDVNENWLIVEYERTQENALFKKETIKRYIDTSVVLGIRVKQEDK